MNSAPNSVRTAIAFFGKCNAGKSTLLNAVSNQKVSIVSEVKGTTTNSVYRTMEILPLGPVLLIDTPGFDDKQEVLGELCRKQTIEVLDRTDIAVFVSDSASGLDTEEKEFLEKIKQKGIPCIVVFNRRNGKNENGGKLGEIFKQGETAYAEIDCAGGKGVEELKNWLAQTAKPEKENPILGDFVAKGDTVVLVVPIDSSAPKGRLILPQQQVIRELLDIGAVCVAVQPAQLEGVLGSLGVKPKLVICDSQAFEFAAKVTPEDITLTSFSILFARYKGDLSVAADGAKRLDTLQDKDIVMISEGCTHHRQCGDIGAVKLPAWIKKYTGKELDYRFTSGGGFDIPAGAKLVIHCGACMLTAKQMQNRIQSCLGAGIPVTNYGIAIAYMKGIFKRSLGLFRS